MSEVKPFESISGSISGESALSGTLSVATGGDYEMYSGEYEVIPSTNSEQVLKTASKLLSRDVVVAKVPYFETSNDLNGKTAYIGKEV